MAAVAPLQTRNRNRIYLLILIGIFLLPSTLAWLLVDKWRPAASINRGELLNPATPVAHFLLHQPGGKEIDASYLRGRWTLAYLDAPCAESCKQALYKIRQIHLALNKDIPRAQTLFIMTAAPEPALPPWLRQEHPQLTYGVADAQTVDFFAQAFPGEPATPGQRIYLIDPLGNLFMRYRSDVNPKDIMNDLQRVLRYSTIG